MTYFETCIQCGARCKPGVSHECAPADAVGEIPPLHASAPERIWLCVTDDPYDEREPFPTDTEGVTWCEDPALAASVPYVRADLSQAPRPESPAVREAASLTNERIEQIAIEKFERWEGYKCEGIHDWVFQTLKAVANEAKRAALQSLPAGPRDSLGDSAEGNTTALQRPAGGDEQ